jgi:hypothetical protein
LISDPYLFDDREISIELSIGCTVSIPMLLGFDRSVFEGLVSDFSLRHVDGRPEEQ